MSMTSTTKTRLGRGRQQRAHDDNVDADSAIASGATGVTDSDGEDGDKTGSYVHGGVTMLTMMVILVEGWHRRMHASIVPVRLFNRVRLDAGQMLSAETLIHAVPCKAVTEDRAETTMGYPAASRCHALLLPSGSST